MLKRHWVSVLLCLCISSGVAHAHPRGLPAVGFLNPYDDGYVLTLWGGPYGDTELDSVFDDLKKTGARHLESLVIGCQTDIHSSDVGSCETRPYAEMMKIADRAIANGFEVSLLPMMASLDGQWRGNYDPSNVEQWFDTYTKWLSRVAADSEKRHLKELVIGSEFSKLQRHDSQWRKLIARIRQIYHGPLVFTANWDALDTVTFWDAVDAIGVSAYFRLSQTPNPTQEELDAAWRSRKSMLMTLSKKWNRPLHITEVGYTNSNTAADTPYYTPATATRDDALQARCFEAFRRAWRDEEKLVRANIWSTSGPESASVEVSADPVGHPAEDVIRQFIEERAALAQDKR